MACKIVTPLTSLSSLLLRSQSSSAPSMAPEPVASLRLSALSASA